MDFGCLVDNQNLMPKVSACHSFFEMQSRYDLWDQIRYKSRGHKQSWPATLNSRGRIVSSELWPIEGLFDTIHLHQWISNFFNAPCVSENLKFVESVPVNFLFMT